MRLRIALGLAALTALALSGNASAGTSHGVVVAKQTGRGAVVVALPGGRAVTVRAPLGGVHVGQLVGFQAVPLRDGTMRSTHLALGRQIRIARIRGVVLRELAHTTLVATGRSVVTIHRGHGRRLASAQDQGGGLQAGSVASFSVQFVGGEMDEISATPAGQTGTAQIEGSVVSTSPFVVSVESLPITITVPSGMTLPTTLAPGQDVELTVDVGANNVFTLVSIGGQEVEATGTVTSSTASQLTIQSGGTTFAFSAPAGATLPTVAAGTVVEAKGISVNGTLTLVALDSGQQSGDGGGNGNGGGNDGGGGDHGGGDG